jgi:hypothetical protein
MVLLSRRQLARQASLTEGTQLPPQHLTQRIIEARAVTVVQNIVMAATVQ